MYCYVPVLLPVVYVHVLCVSPENVRMSCFLRVQDTNGYQYSNLNLKLK